MLTPAKKRSDNTHYLRDAQFAVAVKRKHKTMRILNYSGNYLYHLLQPNDLAFCQHNRMKFITPHSEWLSQDSE
jgi:hypothetical protein